MADDQNILKTIKAMIAKIDLPFFKGKDEKESGAAMTVAGVTILFGVAVVASGVYAFGSFLLLTAETFTLLIAAPVCIAGIGMMWSGVNKILKAPEHVEEVELGGHKFLCEKDIRDDKLKLFNKEYKLQLTKEQYGNFVSNFSLFKKFVLEEAIRVKHQVLTDKQVQIAAENLMHDYLKNLKSDDANKFIHTLSISSDKEDKSSNEAILSATKLILKDLHKIISAEERKKPVQAIVPDRSVTESASTVFSHVAKLLQGIGSGQGSQGRQV